jgi:hypothetical protein
MFTFSEKEIRVDPHVCLYMHLREFLLIWIAARKTIIVSSALPQSAISILLLVRAMELRRKLASVQYPERPAATFR